MLKKVVHIEIDIFFKIEIFWHNKCIYCHFWPI